MLQTRNPGVQQCTRSSNRIARRYTQDGHLQLWCAPHPDVYMRIPDSRTQSRNGKMVHMITLCLKDDQLILNLQTIQNKLVLLINPRRACAARVTVVGSVCLCVCVSVCLCVCYSTSHFSNVRSSHKRYDLSNGQ